MSEIQTTGEKQWAMEEMENFKKNLSSEYINCEADGEDFCEKQSKDQ